MLPATKNSRGFVHIATILAVITILIGAMALVTLNKNRGTTGYNRVLSDSTTNKSDNGIDREIKQTEKIVKISSVKGKFEIDDNGIKAETSLPAFVDKYSGILTVTTPTGTKSVSVLPQEALQNIIIQNIINNLNTTLNPIQIKSNADGTIAYEISGVKKGKLFNMFNIDIPKTIIVSAQNGQVITQIEGSFAQILDKLSF